VLPTDVDVVVRALALSATTLNFDGIGKGFSGPQGAFTVQSVPPSPVGDVGPNHYVQAVNADFAIFNKTGTVLYGPVPLNTLWSGFGGPCETNNDGNPVVLYDPIADRWLISQLSVSTAPYMECVAISQTPDPTGAYFRYAFSYGTDFPDWPKLGVWPDAYYATFNMYPNAGNFSGAKVCAYDRASMLAGVAASQQCFLATDSGLPAGGLLAADLDGARLPPAGTPNTIVALANVPAALSYWKFHVDWTTPANTTLTGPTHVAVPAFTAPTTSALVPQPSPGEGLIPLGDRLMFRAAYRNFGDHEALVTSHAVTAGSSIGVRWYELRLAGGAASLFQSGTHAPDGSYRWTSSIAMDQAGGIALGFSVSSSTLIPGIRYTGRLASDPLGQMTLVDQTIINGTGVQTRNGSANPNWGFGSDMVVDPSDDCTFWYTNEYESSNGASNWSTRIATFTLPGCGGSVTNDFSIAASPSSLMLATGSSGTTTIATAVTSGTSEAVTLSASGLPGGMTAAFHPASVVAGVSSTLAISSGTAPSGTYSVTVTGVAPGASHSVTVEVTVPGTVGNDFSLAANPGSFSVASGGSGSATLSTAVTSGSAEAISLSVSGLPTGASATLSPTSVSAGNGATLVVDAGTAAPGSYTLTVTGTAASATHSASLSLTITGPTCAAQLATCQDGLSSCTCASSSCQANLATCTSASSSCQADLASCASASSTCQSNLAAATQSVTACNTSLASAVAGLTACQSDLGACRSVGADADADGIPDRLDRCPGTPAKQTVDAEGCSLAQFCARVNATTPTGVALCLSVDWQNDEPLVAADCIVRGLGASRLCVPSP
jgi:hypothetical protein